MEEPTNDNDDTLTGNPMLMRKRAGELREKAVMLQEEAREWQTRAEGLLLRAYYLEENAAAFERGEN